MLRHALVVVALAVGLGGCTERQDPPVDQTVTYVNNWVISKGWQNYTVTYDWPYPASDEVPGFAIPYAVETINGRNPGNSSLELTIDYLTDSHFDGGRLYYAHTGEGSVPEGSSTFTETFPGNLAELEFWTFKEGAALKIQVTMVLYGEPGTEAYVVRTGILQPIRNPGE